MNLKKRAYTLLALVAVFNALMIWLLTHPDADEWIVNATFMLGFIMGWLGFGFLYRTGGFFASTFSRYQNVAFGMWMASILMNSIHIPGGNWLVFGAMAFVLFQYIRFFSKAAQREVRDYLGLFMVVVACTMPVLLQFKIISSLYFWWIVSGSIALLVIEFLFNQRHLDRSTFHNRSNMPPRPPQSEPENPFERKS